MLSCWGLLAFIKAADTRRNASFTAKRPKFRGRASWAEEERFEEILWRRQQNLDDYEEPLHGYDDSYDYDDNYDDDYDDEDYDDGGEDDDDWRPDPRAFEEARREDYGWRDEAPPPRRERNPYENPYWSDEPIFPDPRAWDDDEGGDGR